MNKLLLLFFVLIGSTIWAQEGIKPLNSNPALIYPELKRSAMQVGTPESGKTSTVPIQLPFVEDFYYATLSNYPAMIKWEDSLVYVNPGFPIAPPSIGVATFDGLNKFGYPYEPDYTNLAESRAADTLTSRDINLYQSGNQFLQASDSIGFSFYYQARGNGEPPEVGDSLILDFYRPGDGVWLNRVWFAKGNTNPNTNDTAFKRTFIWLADTALLKTNFKFRFRNKATTSGNFDHWHLDYVYLNKNRSMLGDTTYNDLTFAHVPSSFLKDYSAMPYQQYNAGDMAQKNSVRIKNNGAQAINMSYENRFYDKSGNQIHAYSGGANGNLLPFKPNGYSQFAPHQNPAFNYTFSALSDSADFTIKHFLYRSQGTSSDFLLDNDTIYQKQIFRNYYAYDDGGAEGGYYVNGANANIALRFTINKDDDLRAVRIYFDPASALTTVQQLSKFRICVWSNNGGYPGSLIYRDSLMYPKYSDSIFKAIPQYSLTSLVKLNAGQTYFIGIQQSVASGIVIGFDRNQDYHQNLYYNLGNGWTPSQIKGSLMVHPVLGEFIPSPASLNETSNKQQLQVNVFPNPVNESVHLRFENNTRRTVSLYNAFGQLLKEYSGTTPTVLFNTLDLDPGVYLLSIKEGTLAPVLRKIIVQH
ncbi:MAG: T9SS type A sorting domain-containing protein [Bacteroidia bacterium]|nr:T9SS type A sorting domain-containing protein [Bacteroidia bacterium]